jgi:hypothetical protein
MQTIFSLFSFPPNGFSPLLPFFSHYTLFSVLKALGPITSLDLLHFPVAKSQMNHIRDIALSRSCHRIALLGRGCAPGRLETPQDAPFETIDCFSTYGE